MCCRGGGARYGEALRVAVGTFLSDTGDVRGNEFVRRIHVLGKERGVEVRWAAHRGKGQPRTSLLWVEHDDGA